SATAGKGGGPVIAITTIDTVVVVPAAGVGGAGGPTPSDIRTAARFGFALSCDAGCSRAKEADGTEYFRYGYFPPVTDLSAGGIAETAGLRLGDMISRVNGKSILEADGALELTHSDRLTTLTLHVLRNRSYVDLVLRAP